MEIYKIDEVLSVQYLQIPKALIFCSKYNSILSSDSKLVYSILLNRMFLSKKNNWYNENGEIYLICKREELMNLLNISKPTISKVFKELNESELIKEEKQGQGKPNLIYIGKVIAEEYDVLVDPKKSKNFTSESNNNLLQEVKKIYPINNIYNKNKRINNISNKFHSNAFENIDFEEYYDNL